MGRLVWQLGWAGSAWLFAAMLVPVAAQAGAWSKPAVLGGPLAQKNLEDRFPAVAVNRRGESVVAWVADPAHARGVLVATGTPRGRFGSPQWLSRKGSVTAVAVTDDGTVIVVWSDGLRSVEAAVRAPGGRFGRAQRISGSARGSFGEPSLAADRAGDALVAWSRGFRAGAEPTDQVQAVFRPARGAFGAVSTLGAGGSYVHAAVNARGDAVVSWLNVTESGGTFPVPFSRTSVAQFTTRPARGQFGPATTISSSPTTDVTSAISDQGAIAVAWEHANGPESDPYGAIQTSIRAPGGAPEPPVDAPVVNAKRAFAPMITFGSNGELVTAWQEKTHSTPFSIAAPLNWATRTAGRPFGPRQTLTASDATDPQLVPTGDGRALGIWAGPTLGAAVYRSGTGFATTPAPSGSVRQFTKRSLAAAGDFAAFAWQDRHGRLLAAVRKL